MAKLHYIISVEKDLIFQRISILGSLDYRPSSPRNHEIPFGVPRCHARGTTTSCSRNQVNELF